MAFRNIYDLTLVTLALLPNVFGQTSGSFSILTFNVAGLPEIINGNDVPGDKTQNAQTIGTKMKAGGYNIINVQEVSDKRHAWLNHLY
jgi:hypothetical protein